METYIRPYTNKMVDFCYRGSNDGKTIQKAIAPYQLGGALTLGTAALVAYYAPAKIALPIILASVAVLVKFRWTILDTTQKVQLALQEMRQLRNAFKELCFETDILKNLIGLHASQGRLEKCIDRLTQAQITALTQELLTWIPLSAQHHDGEERVANRVFTSLMGGADHLMVAFLSAVGARCLLVIALSHMKDEYGVTLLMRSAWYGNDALVQLLLNAGAHPLEKNRHGSTAFHHAISSGNAEMLDRFFEAHPPLTGTELGQIAGAAALRGHPVHGLKCLKTLLSKSWRMSKTCQYEGRSLVSCGVLGSCSNAHRREVVKALIAAGMDVRVKDARDGKTALMHAVSRDVELVRMLLAAGANLNRRDRHGKTVLMHAVQNRDIEMTKALLAAGASLKRRDHAGKSALMYAVEDLEILKLLLSAGASPEERDHHHKTLFMWAVTHAEPEVVMVLRQAALSHGYTTFLDEKTRDGMTPLMLAIQRDHTRIVSDLIDSGANNAHVVDKKPIQYALEQGSWKSALLLLLRGTSRLTEEEQDGQTCEELLARARFDGEIRDEMLEILTFLRNLERQGTNVSRYLEQFMQENNIHDFIDLKRQLLCAIYHGNEDPQE